MKTTFISIILFFCVFNIVHAKNERKEPIPANVEINLSNSDLKIIVRAKEILAKESSWNRKDNRKCPENAKTFSLYCSLHKASIEINGEFNHRLPALEEVRRTVGEFSKNKNYEHRLMGFNNDPATTYADIKRVLKNTEERLSVRFRR